MFTLKNGIQISDETVELAVKEYFKVHPEEHQFPAGDVAECDGMKRIILCTPENKLVSFNPINGIWACQSGQKGFENYGYKHIGRISDYIH